MKSFAMLSVNMSPIDGSKVIAGVVAIIIAILAILFFTAGNYVELGKEINQTRREKDNERERIKKIQREKSNQPTMKTKPIPRLENKGKSDSSSVDSSQRN